MAIKKDLEKIREIFVAEDLDEEEIEDNLRKIADWENELRSSEDFESWQSSDISKDIANKCRKTYVELSFRLIRERDLTERQRDSIYAKQDAMVLMLSLVFKDVKSIIDGIEREIKQVLKKVED